MKHYCIITILIATIFISSCKKSTCMYYSIDMNVENADNSPVSYSPFLNIDTNLTASVNSEAYTIRIKLFESVINPIANKDYSESVWYQRKYDLEQLNIRTLKPFDLSHAAESDINDYFLSNYGARYNIDYYISSKKLSQKISKLGYKASFTSFVYLMLMKPPLYKGNHEFEVKMKFEDGTTFTDTVKVNLL